MAHRNRAIKSRSNPAGLNKKGLKCQFSVKKSAKILGMPISKVVFFGANLLTGFFVQANPTLIDEMAKTNFRFVFGNPAIFVIFRNFCFQNRKRHQVRKSVRMAGPRHQLTLQF